MLKREENMEKIIKCFVIFILGVLAIILLLIGISFVNYQILLSREDELSIRNDR